MASRRRGPGHRKTGRKAKPIFLGGLRPPWGPTEITTGLVGDNLLDVDVRNSVQFHKDEILLPGRSIKFFMNAKFGAEPPADKASGGYYKGPTGYASPFVYKAPKTWLAS